MRLRAERATGDGGSSATRLTHSLAREESGDHWVKAVVPHRIASLGSLGDRKLSHTLRSFCALGLMVIGLGMLSAGCGSMLNAMPEASAATLVSGGVLVTPANKEPVRIAMDWQARSSTIYPDRRFDPLDLAEFHLDDGSTLADHATEFKALVHAEMESILENLDLFKGIEVVDAADTRSGVETTILLTQSLSPTGRTEIGRGNFDPCNEYESDEALIFGEQIRRLGDRYPLDDWVTLFANVCAHEASHTFGFGHVSRDDIDPSGRALYVELMLDGHTVAEMRRTQRMIHGQTNCPVTDTLAKVTQSATIIRCSHSQ